MCSAIVDSPASHATASRLRVACEVGLIFLVFFIYGAWPAPEVNEPHYLSKARHYWDPSWCANDFLCRTADAHQVFYWTFGWLSRWMSLAAMAWCGRLLTWGLLAWAWRRLSWSLVPAPFYAVLSAALFVTLTDRCGMAGEWVVGGVEAKGFAYVLVLLGLEALVRGRWGTSFLLFGAASSFHVVVGGWSVVAAGVAWLTSANRPPFGRLILPLAGGLLLALPGLLPALALTWHADPQTVREASRIYVYERLNHHLLPQQFPPLFIARHLLLVAALVVLVQFAPSDQRFARLRRFVAAAVGVAAIGMVIGMLAPWQPDLAAGLLRFYWFRLSDVMVPLGMALTAGAILLRTQASMPRWHVVGLVLALVVAGVDLGRTIWWRQSYPGPPADVGIANLEAWQEMCRWAATETPPDAVFLTPRLAQTFRWYAGRGEVVSRKDIPQDALGIVEWWRRMQRIHRAEAGTPNAHWRESLAELGSAQLRALGREFGADYAITAADPPLNLERVGPRNPSFAIYRLSPATSPRAFDPVGWPGQ
jgi:uncharacterized protein DUF6798